MKNISLHHADNLEMMATLPDESIDVICIDPPYLYLKNQKLERAFDEEKFFSECKRLLTKKGFIVMFGRGTSFYRWNYILETLGMVFKEEIVWNKSHCTSPLMNLSRVHETISIFTKKNGTINKVKIPYLEMKGHDLDSVIGDVKRMRSILKNQKSLQAVQSFLENNIRNDFKTEKIMDNKSNLRTGGCNEGDRCVTVINSINNGLNEKSIIHFGSERKQKNNISVQPSSLINEDRSCAVVRNICDGFNEKSIIKQVRDHYSAIHPTQKPVRLLERLLNLVIPKDKEEITIADFFAGSGSTMEAVLNLQKQNPEKTFKGIATEIDEEYFVGMKNRIESLKEEPNLFTKAI